MLEHTWYSVISPESCSSILWRSWDYKERAAEALKLTAADMLKNGLIDGIIKEPLGGAHHNVEAIAESVKQQLLSDIATLQKKTAAQLVDDRIGKFSDMGVVVE